MDPKLQSSFIPKRPITSDVAKPHSVENKGTLSIFLLLAVVIFIIALGLSGGVFLLNRNEQAAKDQRDAQLASVQDAITGDAIAQFSHLENRLNTSTAILKNHTIASVVFKLLQDITTVNVRYTSLVYNISPTGVPTLTLAGYGKSFNSVAYQSDLFHQSTSFKNPIFSGVTSDEHGNALFNISVGLDPKLILYSNNLATSGNTTQPNQ